MKESREKWTTEEDELLKEAVEAFGGVKLSWPVVAESMTAQAFRLPASSRDRILTSKALDKSCRLRWVNQLDPEVIKGRLTTEERARIQLLWERHGYEHCWADIADELTAENKHQYPPGTPYKRTDNHVKNWYNNTHGKEEKKKSKEESKKRRAYDMEEESTAATACKGLQKRMRTDLGDVVTGSECEATTFNTLASPASCVAKPPAEGLGAPTKAAKEANRKAAKRKADNGFGDTVAKRLRFTSEHASGQGVQYSVGSQLAQPATLQPPLPQLAQHTQPGLTIASGYAQPQWPQPFSGSHAAGYSEYAATASESDATAEGPHATAMPQPGHARRALWGSAATPSESDNTANGPQPSDSKLSWQTHRRECAQTPLASEDASEQFAFPGVSNHERPCQPARARHVATAAQKYAAPEAAPAQTSPVSLQQQDFDILPESFDPLGTDSEGVDLLSTPPGGAPGHQEINGLARRESVATWLPLSSWQEEQQAAGNAMEGNHSDLLFQPAAKPIKEQHQAYMPAAVNPTAGLQDNTDSEQSEFERRQFVQSMEALQQQSGQEEPRKEHYSEEELLEFLAYVREDASRQDDGDRFLDLIGREYLENCHE